MKKFIPIILFIVSISVANAQLRFKKLYPEAVSLSKEEAYDLFLEFQKQNPNHACNYYQLGLISMEWMFNYDPLIHYIDVKKLSYDAKLYLGLARHKLDEKQVRRDRNFFQGITPLVGEKLVFSDIKQYLDSIYAVVELYEQKTAIINTAFNKSIDHYNTCVEQYKRINDKRARLKDMVLIIDQATLQEAKELKKNYEMALQYFQQYKNEVSTYDLVKYNQSLNILPITTYRLEGLFQRNFLNPVINIYNYGAWVDQLFETLNNDIKQLRNFISDADGQFDKSLAFLNQSSTLVDKDTDIFRLQDKLRYQIGKFDNASLMVDWFVYRDAQIELFQKNRIAILNPLDNTPHPFLRRAKAFEGLVNSKLKAKETLLTFSNHLTAAKTDKYPMLFGKKYNGTSGIGQQVQKQTIKNDSLFASSLKQLSTFWQYTDSQYHNNNNVFHYKKLKIPTINDSISFKQLKNNRFKTMGIVPNVKGGVYITGIHKINQRFSKPFVAFSLDGKKIDWLRKLNLKGIKYVDTLLFQVLPQGSALLAHGSASPGKPFVNVVVRFDEFGNQQGQTILQASTYPVQFIFDDINETILSVFKGNTKESIVKEPVQVYFNKLDQTPIWSTELQIEGQAIDIVKMDQSYLLFSNFINYTDKGQKIASSATGTNACTTILNAEGKVLGWEKYPSQIPVQIEKAFKLNDNSITLIGNKNASEKFTYVLVDAQGKLRFKN